MGNSYTEYQLMHTFLNILQQGRDQNDQIANHQVEIRREEKIVYQKPLSISDLQIDYLILENLLRNNERSNSSQSRCIYCGGSQQTDKFFKQQQN